MKPFFKKIKKIKNFSEPLNGNIIPPTIIVYYKNKLWKELKLKEKQAIQKNMNRSTLKIILASEASFNWESLREISKEIISHSTKHLAISDIQIQQFTQHLSSTKMKD